MGCNEAQLRIRPSKAPTNDLYIQLTASYHPSVILKKPDIKSVHLSEKQGQNSVAKKNVGSTLNCCYNLQKLF